LVFEKIISADAIIYASPLYSFDITAQLKPLVDRHISLSNTSLLNGKRMALLITCAGQEEGNADLVQEFFRRGFDGAHGGFLNTELIGEYVVPFSNAVDYNERAKIVADNLTADVLDMA
jgi:multimeric flavodoxin WrbA